MRPLFPKPLPDWKQPEAGGVVPSAVYGMYRHAVSGKIHRMCFLLSEHFRTSE